MSDKHQVDIRQTSGSYQGVSPGLIQFSIRAYKYYCNIISRKNYTRYPVSLCNIRRQEICVDKNVYRDEAGNEDDVSHRLTVFLN
ncbi:MAG: hypothetical protein DI535_14945 [Citrobacter freundii]|nr:MAG: hypothetical protein DI535_14945 [Citrobacter freundii]